MQAMSEDAKRPDPLQLALTAIGDFDRAFVKVHEELDLPELFQRAQLRVLFALAAEVRAVRVLMAMGVQDGTAD